MCNEQAGEGGIDSNERRAEACLLGSAEMDEDHRALTDLIEELGAACHASLPSETILAVLTRLISEARRHFADEIRWMERDRYPLVSEHREQHARLLGFLEALSAECHSGNVKLDQQLVSILWDWEIGHINSSDREYAEFLLQHPSGKRLAQSPDPAVSD